MPISVEVWGDYACFTRPEMSVERVSYDVITPSAARGLLESFYWNPGLKWVIDSIYVCNPIRFMNIRRNEVDCTINAKSTKDMISRGQENELYLITSDHIQLRNSLVLRDVRYVINAHFEMTENAAPSDNLGKFQDIIKRRLMRGQYYHMPCFGSREFPAFFKKCECIPECHKKLKGHLDLGWMLLDMDYSDPENITPRFFRAELIDGMMTVPSLDSEVVRK